MKNKGSQDCPLSLDLEHDLQLAVLKRRDPTPIKNEAAYFGTAARRARAARHRKAARDVTRNHASLDDDDFTHHLRHFGTELDLEALIVQTDFERAFSRVPEDCKQAFIRHQEGWTRKQISAELGIPVWMVKRRISKARRKLRKELHDWRRPAKRSRTALTIAILALMLPSIIREGIPGHLTLAGTLTTAVGQHRCQSLPDLSTVCINTGTTIHFDFNSQVRNIELQSGEAYFVVRNDTRPFEVRSGSMVVHDLSTGFAVYRKGTSTIVTVIKGTVAIMTPPHIWQTSPQFHALQQVEFDEVRQVLRQRPNLSQDDLDRLLAWQNGRIDIADAPLDKILEEVRRYHAGVTFRYPPSFRDIKLSGSIVVDDMHALLRMLRQKYGIRSSESEVAPGQTVINLSRPVTPESRGTP